MRCISRSHAATLSAATLSLAIATALALPGSALAARRGTARTHKHASSQGAAALAPIEGRLSRGRGTSESTNWSGYASYGTTFTSVEGTWTQPEANCEGVRKHHYSLAAFWVGLDGYESNTVEQTGSEADCEGSKPVYYVWYELYPKGLVLIEDPVAPGDVLHAEVTETQLVLQDLSSEREWEAVESYLPTGLRFNSAEWIAEAPARNALTSFGSVHFSSASASSEALSNGAIESEAWSDDSITLVSGSPKRPTTLATPGALEEEGRAFTIEQLASGAHHGRH